MIYRIMINIYILGLKCDKYYIGKTNKVKQRINEHIIGNGASWVKRYPPEYLIDFIEKCDPFDEDKYTLKYMEKFGIDNVRGGSFCEINLTRDNIKTINKMISTATNRCYLCGEYNHFANSCYYRKY